MDGFDYSQPNVPFAERPEIDRWVLSELNTLVKNVQESLDDYEPTRAGRLIQTFVIDNLSNWYVRLNRKRFWGGEMDADKLSAYQTLYICLETIAKLIAPIAPFYADRLFMDLIHGTGRENVTSVHLSLYPKVDESLIDSELETRMELAQQITSMVLSLRKKEQIIVRQPLQTISIPVTDSLQKERIEQMKQLILDEVNVKELQFVEGGAGMLVKKVKCNFRVMGKKFGKMMKAVSNAVAELTQEQIAELESKEQITIQAEGQDALIELADVEIFSEDISGWTVANEGSLTVALDINITPELKNEAVAREIIKRIQGIRKDSGFEITDRIQVVISESPAISGALAGFKDYIASQVLANSIEMGQPTEGTEVDFDDFKAIIHVKKA